MHIVKFVQFSFSVICFELFALSLKPPFILFVLHVLYQIACERK